jgi:hypothetical protein
MDNGKTAQQIIDAALTGGRVEIAAIAANGAGNMEFSDEEMSVLLAEHGTPGDALYAVQRAAQYIVSAQVGAEADA